MILSFVSGHECEIFESRNFMGGKCGSWVDKDGNHIEMGLHVFFGCYYNLFGILERVFSLLHFTLLPSVAALIDSFMESCSAFHPRLIGMKA